MIYDLQRASMWKRISAFLFDAILLGIVAVLMGYLLSAALHYDRYSTEVSASYDRVAAEYGVSFDISSEEYARLSPEEAAVYDEALQALNADQNAVHAYGMVVSLTITIISIGLLLAFIILEFTVPMLLGNGQTLGKKIFGIAVMRSDSVRIGGVALFIRTVLGKYTVETMIPVMMLAMMLLGTIGIVGPLIIAAVLLPQLVLLCTTRERSALHDKLAGTVCVDMGSQMIFNTREDMIAYKERKHAEEVSGTRTAL